MRFLLAIANIVLALTLLAWPLGLLLLVFMFDAPGAETSPWTKAAAWSILLYPVPVVAGTIGYWRNRKETTLQRRARYTLLALCGPGLVVLVFAAIALFCGGSFVCT